MISIKSKQVPGFRYRVSGFYLLVVKVNAELVSNAEYKNLLGETFSIPLSEYE